jgi:hypothetical protein
VKYVSGEMHGALNGEKLEAGARKKGWDVITYFEDNEKNYTRRRYQMQVFSCVEEKYPR